MKNVQDLLARVATTGQPATLSIEATRLEVEDMEPLISFEVVTQVAGRLSKRRLVVRSDEGAERLLERVAGAIAAQSDDHVGAIAEREAAVAEVAARNERDRAAAKAAEDARRVDPGPAEPDAAPVRG